MKAFFLLTALLLLADSALAQKATLSGQVVDETGAVIPAARVVLAGPGGLSRTVTAGADGSYSFTDLPVGTVSIIASAPDLALLEPVAIALKPGSQSLNLVLKVVATKQQVSVEENAAPSVSVEAANNASALVLRGSDLDALSDNPDDLAADLQALAGPAAGPNGGAIYIDGFSGGELPPKTSIREIRINQNPFSSEYDKLGFGRIEIFTKPGSDKFRGSVGYNFANDVWNSRNAYAAVKAPFRLNESSANLSGPLSKRASFNVSLMREWVDNGNVVNGFMLQPQTLAITPFSGTPVSKLRRIGATPRIDYQISTNHTLTMRYSYYRDIVEDAGTGGLNLLSEGYHYSAPSQNLQLTETAILGASAVNETRFQYFRPETVSQANSSGFALQVLGAFNGGGNTVGRTTDLQNTYEFQNYTSLARKAHSLRFGVRVRGATDTNTSPQNYNGTFTFSGGLAPELDANNNPVMSGGQFFMVNISSIESYQRTLLFQQLGYSAALIRQLGGGASQFTVNAGNPTISGGQVDVGAFIGDDWKAKSNLTVSLGLRYETQSNIHDWRDIAPRIGIAWAPGPSKGRSKNVIRAGFGMFYDRFGLGNTLTAMRNNGIIQQQYVITSPDFFPMVPAISSLTGPVPPSTIQEISSSLRAPYLMQSALAWERQLPFNSTLSITYANSHGLHELRSQDINAPVPGTYNPAVPGSGIFPLGRPGVVALMESAGLYNQNQLILNVNTRVNRSVSLTGSYMYNRARSNTDGLGTFPATPYSLAGEYGPASTDIHNRVSLAGTITAKWGIRFNPLLTANTGPPFNITSGQDLYADSLFNGRPGIATNPNKPGVIATAYGLLDPNPTPGEAILPRNFGRGPGQIMLNMRVGRTFSFGPTRESRAGADSSGGGGGGGG